MPLERTGVAGQVADRFKRVIIASNALGTEPQRVSRVVGLHGELSQRVVRAVADADLSKMVTSDVGGEMLDLKHTINAVVDQLDRFASEATRVAREVRRGAGSGRRAATWGVHAPVSSSGRPAAVSREHDDAILMDRQMPETDGSAATAAICAREPRGTHIPIIAFTAGAAAEDPQECRTAGMDSYVSKPARGDVPLVVGSLRGRPS